MSLACLFVCFFFILDQTEWWILKELCMLKQQWWLSQNFERSYEWIFREPADVSDDERRIAVNTL